MNLLSLCALLGTVFVLLKLMGSISWPWWVVMAPFWGCAALTALVAVWTVVYLWWTGR